MNEIFYFDSEIKQTGWNREPDQNPKHLELILKWKYTEPKPWDGWFYICSYSLCNPLSHLFPSHSLSFSLLEAKPHNGEFGFVLCLSQNPHMVEKLLFSFRTFYSNKFLTNPNLTILLKYKLWCLR